TAITTNGCAYRTQYHYVTGCAHLYLQSDSALLIKRFKKNGIFLATNALIRQRRTAKLLNFSICV
ncbi:MAG: hypothetical protein KZQ72_06170, partial [Candidatus Thiodiazotropha sp. (ex Cardiolucina cf. quadrata)]|nr:hypothetical protein [Candidatus Thiodiazotropha sp. (ex Cardiolucina cf. quadrata)]